MRFIIAYSTLGLIAISFVTSSIADSPKPSQADARAKIEAQVLAKAQAKCSKDGKVAFAQHLKGAFMIKCVSSDDPGYKAQHEEKPAQ